MTADDPSRPEKDAESDTPESRTKRSVPIRLTAEQLLDCHAFAARWDAINAGKIGHDRVSAEDLARLARKRGAAPPDRSEWIKMKNGLRALDTDAKIITAIAFNDTPQSVFASWPYNDLTPIPPGEVERLPRLVRILTEIPEPERTEFLEMVQYLLNAKPDLRKSMIRAMKEAAPAQGKTRGRWSTR